MNPNTITAAFIGTLLKSQRSSIQTQGGGAAFVPDNQSSFVNKVGGLQYKAGVDNVGFDDNEGGKKSFDLSDFLKFDPKMFAPRKSYNQGKLQNMVKKGDFDGVEEAYRRGANPDLKFANDDKMIHLLTRELNNKDGLEGRIMPLMSAIQAYATAGGDLGAENKVGETPKQIVEDSGDDKNWRDYRSLVNHKIDKLQKEQLGHFYTDDKGNVFSGPQQYASFPSPTEQMFYLASQKFKDMNQTGKERAAKLIESGVDFGATLGDIYKGTKQEGDIKDPNTPLSELVHKNWGLKKAEDVAEIVGVVKKIDNFVENNISEDFGKLKSPTNIKTASAERQQEVLDRLLATKELKGLYAQLDEASERFSGDQKTQGFSR